MARLCQFYSVESNADISVSFIKKEPRIPIWRAGHFCYFFLYSVGVMPYFFTKIR